MGNPLICRERGGGMDGRMETGGWELGRGERSVVGLLIACPEC